MRKRKLGIAVLALIVAFCCCGAIACGTKSDTTAPVIKYDGKTSIALFVGDAAPTIQATATDETDGEIKPEIVWQDGAVTDGKMNLGTWTVKITAKDKAGNKSEEITITLTVSAVPEDKTAPVINISGSKKLTTQSGVAVDLPTATATDDKDGNLTDSIYIYTESKGKIEDGKFTSSVAGTHVIYYYVADEAQNEATETVEVEVTPIIAEDFDVNGVNDITALSNDGGVYKENFEKMYQSGLIKNSMPASANLEATNRSIAGNSLVIDYNKTAGGENRVFLSALTPYMKTGKWSITFDVKLISGTAFSDFYFGYQKEGTISGNDVNYSIADLTVGNTKTIEYTQLINLDGGTWWFQFFKLNQNENMDCVLAFDNFTFKYQDMYYPTSQPSIEELEKGYTYNWNDKYAAISSALPEKVTDLPSEIQTAISGDNGFGTNVMHLYSNGSHIIAGLTKDNNAEYFTVGRQYTLSMKLYSAVNGSFHLIALDGTSGNRTIQQISVTKGVNEVEITWDIRANEYQLTFYGSMDCYFGNMTMTLADPVKGPYEDRTDTYSFTLADVTAENGYTYDYTTNKVFAIGGDAKWAVVERLEDSDIKAALTAANGFSATALYLKSVTGSSNYVTGFEGKLTNNYDYTLTFNAYEKTKGDLALLIMSAAGAQQADVRFTRTQVSGNVYKYTASFTATADFVKWNLYAVNAFELYIGNFNIFAVEHKSSATTAKGFTVGQVWTKTGASINQFNKLTEVNTPEGAVGKEGFGEKAYKVDMAANNSFEVFNDGNVFEANAEYKVTVYYYVECTEAMDLMINFDNNDFDSKLDGSNGYHKTELTISKSHNYFSLYTGQASKSGTVYLAKIVIELTAIK